MERETKKPYIIMLMVCAFVAALAGFLLAGCSSSPELRFSRDEISLFVGDERDMALYATFVPATADDRSFSLKSDNACVEVHGTKIKGVAPGTAVVTASNGGHTAVVKITVEYRTAQSLVLDTDGNTVQTLGALEPIEFSASLDDYSDPEIEIVWSVNGERKGAGAEYLFEPNGVGEFDVTASAAELSATETVAVYRATEAEGHS
ncbi:MAG: hypothetical protein K2M48_00500, partial [Clostridiales bacterium]|nr:hypothetical protein [Clostridiales bacterium]